MNARGIDDPAVIDTAGTYDAGALEAVSDVLFKDGFESSGGALERRQGEAHVAARTQRQAYDASYDGHYEHSAFDREG